MATAPQGNEASSDDADGTPLERMVSAGIDESRARERITQGSVQLDGKVVDQPGASAPWPSRWIIKAAN